MAAAKEQSQRAGPVDVETVLQILHQRTCGELQEFMDNEVPLRSGVGGDAYDKLAQAFEFDVHDSASCEWHR